MNSFHYPTNQGNINNMSTRPAEAKPLAPNEVLRDAARSKASESWTNLSTGIREATITPLQLLNETRSLINHMHVLSKDEQEKVKKSYKQFSGHAKEAILSQVKPVLIEQITSHTGKAAREQDLIVAEMLGLLGNRFGVGVDREVSSALGPDSPIARRRLQTGAGAAALAGLGAYYGPDAIRTVGAVARIGKYINYVAQASSKDSELVAPQPKPNTSTRKEAHTNPSPTPKPVPPSPAASPSPSPEVRKSPTTTKEPTKPPTSTPEPEPTATNIPEPTPTHPPEPTSTNIPEPIVESVEDIPEPDPETEADSEPLKENMVEIGSQNLAEFFLGQWVEDLKGKGVTLWEQDSSFRERVTKENAESGNITLVYLGTDNERDRDRQATTTARADVIMIEVFNPHTFQTTSISLNRDLFAPEVTAEFGGFDRINSATMLPTVKNEANPYPLIQRMLESATGLRIDGILQTNIDFVNGYDAYHDVFTGYQEGKNSIIDRFVPEGIEVNPPDVIDDPQYPKGFGVQHVRFNKGPQVLHGQDLVKYARARKGDGNNDYMRSERQREVAFKVFRGLASKIVDDLEQGSTGTLDVTLEVLQEQQEAGNFFQYDIDIIDMLGGINDSIKKIMEMPNGNQIIAKLAVNSMGNVARLLGAEASKRYGLPLGDPGNGFTSYGLSMANGSLEGHSGAVTRLKGSAPHTDRKTSQGNYIDYWQPLRDKVAELTASA